MNILISNDDGYTARGLETLVKILRPFGNVTVVAPKYHQSGTSMAINMGFKPLPAKKLIDKPGEVWYYLDGTPSSCVKFGLDNVMYPVRPDVVVSGINHGANYATAALYSATLGAAKEGAVNGIPAIGVSVDDMRDNADFTAVEALFPEIFKTLMDNLPGRRGEYYNINFPRLPLEQIKGVGVGHMGMAHWEREYVPYNEDVARRYLEKFGITNLRPESFSAEEGEELYFMAGDFTDEENADDADNRLVDAGYISLSAHNINDSDFAEIERLRRLFK